jgi:hypothetical protein
MCTVLNGRTNPPLKGLVALGMVRRLDLHTSEDGKLPHETVYEITAKGRKALERAEKRLPPLRDKDASTNKRFLTASTPATQGGTVGGPPPVQADRAFWESKAREETLKATDNLLQLVKEVEPKATLNYTKYYIGLDVDGISRNFVSFVPKKAHVLMSIRVPETKEVNDLLEQAGIEPLASDWRGQYKVRIAVAPDNKQQGFLAVDDKQRAVLRQLVHQASEEFAKA